MTLECDTTLQVSRQCEIYSSIYYGGVSPQIRKQVWPYLLDHYKFGMSKVRLTINVWF